MRGWGRGRERSKVGGLGRLEAMDFFLLIGWFVESALHARYVQVHNIGIFTRSSNLYCLVSLSSPLLPNWANRLGLPVIRNSTREELGA